MEILATIVSGTAVYVAGRIAEKILVDPVQEIRRTIVEIQVDLVFYANVYTAVVDLPQERRREASIVFRTKAASWSALPRYCHGTTGSLSPRCCHDDPT